MRRAYWEFFTQGEKTRRWHPMNDVPWDWFESPEIKAQVRDKAGPAAREDVASCLETFCAIELFIPDYTRNGLNQGREIFGQSWFHLAWGFEESRHAAAFREYLVRSGLRTEDEYQKFESSILTRVWEMPFPTARSMACYGALQEIATFLIYSECRRKFSQEDNPVLPEIFRLVARDEAAHAVFYRDWLEFELGEDREGTLADLAWVLKEFQMPGVTLVPDFELRLKSPGVAITSQDFFLKGIIPTLKKVGVSRAELFRARARHDELRASRSDGQDPAERRLTPDA